MGWWETGQGDDVIGDEPADTITTTLRAMAEAYEEQGKQKPTVQQLLNAILSALRLKPEQFIDEGNEISIQTLTAKFESTLDNVSSSEDNIADNQLVTALCDAFEEVAVEYEDAEMERKPRLSELLTSIAFVLGYEPEEYLSVPEGTSVTEIVANLD
jgi:hypothetical protein